MGAGHPPQLCVACRGELLPDSRFCGRCGAPQPAGYGADVPMVSSPQAQTLPLDNDRRRRTAPPPRIGRTIFIVLIVTLLVGGGAVAGVYVARHGGGRKPFLHCPGGVCPRFPIDRLARLEVTDPAFGRVRLFVPPAALRGEAGLTVGPSPFASVPPHVFSPAGDELTPTAIGPAIRLGPDGQTFEKPVRLELPFDATKLDGDDQISVLTWTGANGERLAPIAVDRDGGFVTVETVHFSDFVVVIDPGDQATFAPPPCPPVPRRAIKCPWTPDGYTVGECGEGYCWDGGPQGFLACKQTVVGPGIARGENLNPYCATGTPVWDRCTGVLLRCDQPPAPP